MAYEVVLDRYRDDLGVAPSQHVSVRPAPRPELRPGQVRVRNSHLGLAAVNADQMQADPGLPFPGFTTGEALYGSAVGEVVESRADQTPVGTVVEHMAGWRTESVLVEGEYFAVPEGVFPGPEFVLKQGVTAYHGVVDVAQVGEGDVVWVSGAAGGVGSLAGQIARCRGARLVIGTAGGPQKCRYLVEQLGFDVAIDYKAEDVEGRLREVAPQGISVFFDNVGGEQFEIALRVAADEARLALCGTLAGQVDGGAAAAPPFPILRAIVKDLVIRPFRTLHTGEQIAAWATHYAQWFAAGELVFPHTVVRRDLAGATRALDELLAGDHRGSVVVALEQDDDRAPEES